MPRKNEPSFDLKQIIWDLAATIGTDNYAAILRQVDEKLRQLHKNEELFEDKTPDIRTLRRIIERDIQRLTPELVIAKLPRHTWHLRSDHKDVERLAEGTKEQPQVPAEVVIRQEKNEKHLIQLQQKEHIKTLQQMAKHALDHLPDLPDLQNEPEVFDSFNDAVVKVYRRLTGDVGWKGMAEHLGDQGNEIEMMSSVLDDVLPGGSLRRPKLNKYKRDLDEAWYLIKIRGLKTISESSDTRLWEWEGLSQRCQNCPDQEYEPVGITPEDTTSSRVFPEYSLSDWQADSDEHSSTGK
jgi:hypothetical protein